jgi:uncharacterized protein YhfF
MLDNSGNQVATLVVTRAEVLRFADVPDELAIAEGEGDLDADEFRTGHLKDWTALGHVITDDTLVTNIYFDLIEDLRNERPRD